MSERMQEVAESIKKNPPFQRESDKKIDLLSITYMQQ